MRTPKTSWIISTLILAGGIITLDDLLEYRAVLNEDPLRLNVGEYTMHVPDAPSSGPVLALILNIVDGERAEFHRRSCLPTRHLLGRRSFSQALNIKWCY